MTHEQDYNLKIMQQDQHHFWEKNMYSMGFSPTKALVEQGIFLKEREQKNKVK